MARKEPDTENFSLSHKAEIVKQAKEQGNKSAKNEFPVCQFILGADNKRYKKLKTALANCFVFGNDNYPKDTTQALTLFKNSKDEGGKTSNSNSNSNRNNKKDESLGVAFV